MELENEDNFSKEIKRFEPVELLSKEDSERYFTYKYLSERFGVKNRMHLRRLVLTLMEDLGYNFSFREDSDKLGFTLKNLGEKWT